jgi:sigma-B regulation protein RsbU (phosphoserine phosphatase)
MVASLLRADGPWLQRLRKLTEVSRALTNTLSLEELLHLVVMRAAEVVDAEKAVLMLVGDDGVLSVGAAHGLEQAVCDQFREPFHETLITRLQGLLSVPRPEDVLAVPLVVGGDVMGVLAAAPRAKRDAADEEEWLLSAFADQAAVALEKTRLDETAEFRERLIGIVSHDLSTPISAIAMSAETVLKREGLDHRTMRAVVRIQNSADRAARMIQDLLDFTQARLGGGIHIERRATNLQAIVQEVVDELSLTHPERSIVVTARGDTSGEWDPDRITQAVGNLVQNALHYSPSSSEVRLGVEGDGDHVVVTVHNDGPPIPRERLPQIFEPLRRATTELTKRTRSVGLGLYIVKHIVDAHRGTVLAESSLEQGTTLTVRLPRQAPGSAKPRM